MTLLAFFVGVLLGFNAGVLLMGVMRAHSGPIHLVKRSSR